MASVSSQVGVQAATEIFLQSNHKVFGAAFCGQPILPSDCLQPRATTQLGNAHFFLAATDCQIVSAQYLRAMWLRPKLAEC